MRKPRWTVLGALTFGCGGHILVLVGAAFRRTHATHMISELKELFKYKGLLKQLVVRDLKVRYKNSVLGFFWSLLNPLVQVATITIVMKYVLRLPISNYSAIVLVAYLPWIFFQMALLDSSQVILLHRDLLRKVYFPRELLPLSVAVANLVHFLLALVVFFAYLTFYWLFLHGASIMVTVLWLPVLIALQFLLIVGLAFFISCLNVFYADVKYVLTALLGVVFYVTPIMYPSELVREALGTLSPTYQGVLFKIYMLSPLNALTSAYRKLLLPQFSFELRGVDVTSLPMDYGMLAVAAVVCLLFAVAGYKFFNSRKWIFAERA